MPPPPANFSLKRLVGDSEPPRPHLSDERLQRRHRGAQLLIRDVKTVEAFSRSDLTDLQRLGFSGSVFGAPSGLIPLLNTDRGEDLFGVMVEEEGAEKWRLFSCDGDEVVLRVLHDVFRVALSISRR